MTENSAEHLEIVKTALKGFCLTEVESTVYTTVLNLGSRSAGGISKYTGINRSYTYDVLASLEKKGLIQEIDKNGVKHYSCTDLETLLEALENREREAVSQKECLKKSLPDLNKLRFGKNASASSLALLDARQIENIYDEMLRAPGSEILSFVGRFSKPNQQSKKDNAIRRFSKRRMEQGIWYRTIVSDVGQRGPRSAGDLSEIRVLNSLEMPSELLVFGQNVSIIDQNDSSAVVLKSATLAESLRTIHQALWRLLPAA